MKSAEDERSELEPVFTIKRLAEHTGSSPATIRAYIDSGELRHFSLNRKADPERRNIRVRLSAWDEFVERKENIRDRRP